MTTKAIHHLLSHYSSTKWEERKIISSSYIIYNNPWSMTDCQQFVDCLPIVALLSTNTWVWNGMKNVCHLSANSQLSSNEKPTVCGRTANKWLFKDSNLFYCLRVVRIIICYVSTNRCKKWKLFVNKVTPFFKKRAVGSDTHSETGTEKCEGCFRFY